jgi:hypothetical protein
MRPSLRKAGSGRGLKPESTLRAQSQLGVCYLDTAIRARPSAHDPSNTIMGTIYWELPQVAGCLAAAIELLIP